MITVSECIRKRAETIKCHARSPKAGEHHPFMGDNQAK